MEIGHRQQKLWRKPIVQSMANPTVIMYKIKLFCKIKLQLDWPRIADWAYAITFAVDVRFKFRDQL